MSDRYNPGVAEPGLQPQGRETAPLVYEPPVLVRLGTLAELTRGETEAGGSDGVFTGSEIA